jgi:shikimate kinase
LFGFKGCGKSYWARKLSQITSIPYLDTDLEVERLYHRQTNTYLTVGSIYQTIGSNIFQNLEHQIVSDLFNRLPHIIALGGSTPLTTSLPLSTLGPLIYLDVSWDTIASRKCFPQYLPQQDLKALQKLYLQRRPLYKALPYRAKIECCRYSEPELLQQLLTYLQDGIQ